MFLLYVVNSSSEISMSSVVFYFSMFQNFFGWYFRISGSVNYILARSFLQMSLNMVYAIFVYMCFFPFLRFVCLYCCFAFLQSSLYQGAKCLDHRFGFFWFFSMVLFITPAFLASSIRNSSIFYERSSLSSL